MSVDSIFNLAALVVTLAALCGWINHRWLRLPHTIGLVLIALAVSFVALLIDALVPGLGLGGTVRETLTQVDFHDTLMTGMLGFLLFAGALHVDLESLISRRWAISTLATAGILLSTALSTFHVERFLMVHAGADYASTGRFALAALSVGRPTCWPVGPVSTPRCRTVWSSARSFRRPTPSPSSASSSRRRCRPPSKRRSPARASSTMGSESCCSRSSSSSPPAGVSTAWS